MVMPATTLPRLFVGSSNEGKNVAHAVRQQLRDVAEVTLWSDGPFGLGGGTLESLVAALADYDFAVLVITADDLTTSRGKEEPSPRDNVVFEAGLFMGRLGRSRTFLVYDANARPKLPSDLAGITIATFRRRSGDQLRGAVGEATDDVRERILALGPYLSMTDPRADAKLPLNARAKGLCSSRHSRVSVGVHPIGTKEYWLRRANVVDGTWTAEITIGTPKTSSGSEYDIAAFLEPNPTVGANPLAAWPSALASSPVIRVRRA